MTTEDDVGARAAPSFPRDLPPRAWLEALVRAARGAWDDDITDWAAALTYYAVLSIGPGLIVLAATLGLVGQYPQTSNALLDIVDRVGPGSAVETFRGPIESVIQSKQRAGSLLGVGLLGALWAASGYLGAFFRASNVVYGIRERRPFWTRRPLQIVLTVLVTLLVTIVTVAIALTGTLAEAVGAEVGLGPTAVTLWSWGKWPVLAVIVLATVAVLLYLAPSERPPRIRWVTPGGVLAVVVWVAASLLLGLYAAHFQAFGGTYGSLGGVVLFLVWSWLSNLALLLGAEYNAELLEAGNRHLEARRSGRADDGPAATRRRHTAPVSTPRRDAPAEDDRAGGPDTRAAR